MANRVLAGNHPTYGYGLFVSQPGINVLTASTNQLVFDSRTFRSGVIYKTFSPSTTSDKTWTSSSLGYIPAVITAGIRPDNYFFVDQISIGGVPPTFGLTLDFQTAPFTELTETTIDDFKQLPKGNSGGYNSNTNIHVSNYSTSNVYAFLRFPCHYGKMNSSALFGQSSDTYTLGSSTSANRILIGNHGTYGQGMYVSRPGVDVTSASRDEMIFSTDSNVGQDYSSVLKIENVTLTRASSNTSSANDHTFTYENTGSTPAVEVRVQGGVYSANGVTLVSQTNSSTTLRLPLSVAKGNQSNAVAYKNPSTLSVTAIVIKRG
tara:strand:- start:12212 stop:13171 length:960 start_codon:yes stop_codon:yes gene_type:complete